MPLYLTLSRGPRADLAQPVLASSDPSVIRGVLDLIRRMSDEDEGPAEPRLTPLTRRLDDEEEHRDVAR